MHSHFILWSNAWVPWASPHSSWVRISSVNLGAQTKCYVHGCTCVCQSHFQSCLILGDSIDCSPPETLCLWSSQQSSLMVMPSPCDPPDLGISPRLPGLLQWVESCSESLGNLCHAEEVGAHILVQLFERIKCPSDKNMGMWRWLTKWLSSCHWHSPGWESWIQAPVLPLTNYSFSQLFPWLCGFVRCLSSLAHLQKTTTIPACGSVMNSGDGSGVSPPSLEFQNYHTI